MSLKKDQLKPELAAALSGSTPGDIPAAQAAACIERLLNPVLAGFGTCCRVDTPPYPPCGKIPMIITMADGNQRMLWFYPGQSEEWLADELAELLSGMLEEYIRIPA